MVVGVRFRPCGRMYFFETNGVNVGRGIRVVAESEMGLKLGTVIKEKCIIEEPEQQIKKILRVATEEDIEADKNNRSLEEEARIFCIDRAKAHNLPMKVVAVESTLDRKRLIFYFTADGRIDFRNLVRDLAGKYKTRIEMRQIGVRDEVKFISGIGACGRQTCCSLFLTSFEPVSIGMAKKQELVLNPEKLSGICGRLKCCLRYEYKSEIRSEHEEPVEEEITSEIRLEPEEQKEEQVLIIEPAEGSYRGEDTMKLSEDSSTGCFAKDIEYRTQKTEARKDKIQDTGRSDLGNESRNRVVPTCRPTRKPVSGYKSKRPLAETHFRMQDESLSKGTDRVSGVMHHASETTAQDAITTHQEKRKEKGKPFSRRKGFWKKKRR